MSHYDMVRLGDVFQVVTGSTPPTSELRYYGGETPFITPAELDQVDPINLTTSQLTEEGVSISRLLPANTILVCCIGSLGKVGISGRSSVTNQQINALIPNEKLVNPRYALHACRKLKPTLEAIAPSTTVKIVNKTRFSDLQIPLPSLKEQRRIAAILDQAEALRAKRRQALAKLKTLLKTSFDELIAHPGESQHLPLEEALSKIIDYRGKSPRKSSEGVPLITARIVKKGVILPATEYIAESDYVDWMRRGIPQAGDVLFTTEAPLGEVARLGPQRVALAQRLLVLRGKSDLLDNEYLMFVLSEQSVRDDIKRRSTGSTVKGIRQVNSEK